jgi:DNA polymerase-3 subunit delta
MVMIMVLTGSNDFARSSELAKITTAFIKEHGDFGLEKIEAGNVELGRLLESVASQPFLAARRMIILTDVGTNKSLAENIDKLLDAVADTTDLIINEPKFDKRLNLYKTLKKRADLREFTAMDERNLPRWLADEARRRGGELSISDAAYLVQRIGTNQLMASNELDKLLIHDPKITKAAIDLLTDLLPQSSVFDLLDAAFAGDTKKALHLYEEQRRQQVEPQAIMGMIAWQMHILTVVKANEKLGADGIASAAKLSPFVVRKTLNITRRLSLREVKNLLKRVLDLDIRLKSEPIDADDALQHLLLTI